MDIALVTSPTGEAIGNLVIGVGFIAGGCLSLIRTPDQEKARLARKFALPPEDLDRLFRVIYGPVSRIFTKWQGAALVLAGLSRLAALLLGQHDNGICIYVLAFCILNLLIAGGLSMVFTGRAQYYLRRVIWQGFGARIDRSGRFTGQDSWWATLNIIWMRLFGVFFLSVIVGLLYIIGKAWLGKL